MALIHSIFTYQTTNKLKLCFAITFDLFSCSVPDNIILDIMRERLAQLDCVSRGWVLHGYPRTREQAEALAKDGFVPNRYGNIGSSTDICLILYHYISLL